MIKIKISRNGFVVSYSAHGKRMISYYNIPDRYFWSSTEFSYIKSSDEIGIISISPSSGNQFLNYLSKVNYDKN